jgi:hypothetical protein
MKPAYLYHGSTTSDIKILIPKLRHTPGELKEKKEAIYAASDPAYAAGHAFPWTSKEGNRHLRTIRFNNSKNPKKNKTKTKSKDLHLQSSKHNFQINFKQKHKNRDLHITKTGKTNLC